MIKIKMTVMTITPFPIPECFSFECSVACTVNSATRGHAAESYKKLLRKLKSTVQGERTDVSR